MPLAPQELRAFFVTSITLFEGLKAHASTIWRFEP